MADTAFDLTAGLNSLPVYASNARSDSLLDPLRMFLKADAYGWLPVSVPGPAAATIGARQTYEDQIVVPPGSYLTMLTGLSNQAAGFTVNFLDESLRQRLSKKPLNAAIVMGQGVAAAGAGLRSGPYILPSPLVVGPSGVLTIELVNLAAVAAIIECCFFFAVPRSAASDDLSQQLSTLGKLQTVLLEPDPRKFSSRVAGAKAPWVEPPDAAQPFDAAGVIATPAIGVTATALVLVVPRGYDGVIRRFSCNVNGPFVEGSGDLVWRILADGRAVRNYDNIIVQMGSAISPRVTDGIRVSSGQTLAFTISNVAYAVGGTQIYCFLSGYFYPKPSGEGSQ